MLWTLTDSTPTVFEISNGVTSDDRVVDVRSVSMQQVTQRVTKFRADFPTAFPDRASRVQPLSLPVMFPPCASDAAAASEAVLTPIQCPKGGELEMQLGAVLVTWAQAVVESIEVERFGLSNRFTFNLTAYDPQTSALSTLAQMNANYIVNLPSITGLAGGTATDLDSYTTTDVAAGLTVFIVPTIGGIAQPKTFRLIAGTTAENTDPTAGPLVVRPDDYNAATNAKVWAEVQ